MRGQGEEVDEEEQASSDEREDEGYLLRLSQPSARAEEIIFQQDQGPGEARERPQPHGGRCPLMCENFWRSQK